MRTLNYFIAFCFSLALVLSSCGTDPKPVSEEDRMYAPEEMSEASENTTSTATQIAADKKTVQEATEAADKLALAETKKAEEEILATEKKEKEAKEQKERRRKRREKRKKAAAEKEKNLADNTVKTYDQAPPKEDLSNVDPELLDMVQVKNTGGAPRIKFDAETYDFGRIMEGKEIDHKFTFTNTGSSPLVVKDVQVTCGCTTPFYPFIPIEPGETGVIGVHFNSKGRLGNQNPTITVYTNAEPDKYELHLKGVIDTEREGGQ